MFNDWLTIGPITIHGYGVMIALGILAAFYVSEKQAKKTGLSSEIIDNLIFVCLVSGYACSKLTYVLINFSTFLENPAAVLGAGGWVVYGGILGGILGAYLYCKKKGVRFIDYFNLLIPQVALAQAFGRVGCFLAGCCYGMCTNSALGVTFPQGSLAPAGVKLIPTQLISSLGDLLIFLVLRNIFNNASKREETGAWYLILYSIGRFMIEFLRGDVERGSVGPLSTSQFIAIFVLIAGILLLCKVKKQKPKTETAQGE